MAWTSKWRREGLRGHGGEDSGCTFANKLHVDIGMSTAGWHGGPRLSHHHKGVRLRITNIRLKTLAMNVLEF
jgi:hypothetical protein